MAKAIVVLGSGVDMHGRLPPQAAARVEKAVSLWKRAKDAHLVMSGRWSFLTMAVFPKTEAQAMKDQAVKLGVPARAIALEEESRDTLGNAYYVKKVLARHGWKEVTVITSDYHLPRTKYIFPRILGPGYRLRYAAAPSRLPAAERRQRRRDEEKVLALTRAWLDPLIPGHDEAVKRLLFTLHPAYAEKPAVTKEQLLAMLSQ
jgi:uncharacterized SAM-binding protein YcdF (DUF218 family)